MLTSPVLCSALVADLVTELRIRSTPKHSLNCPSSHCNAYYLTLATSGLLLFIYVTQLLVYGLVLYEIRSTPRSINRERSYRALLNRETTQLLSLRQQGAEARSPGLDFLRTRYSDRGETTLYGIDTDYNSFIELPNRLQRTSDTSLTSFTARDDFGYARRRARTISADVTTAGLTTPRQNEVSSRRIAVPTLGSSLQISPLPSTLGDIGLHTKDGLTPSDLVSIVYSDQYGLGTPSRLDNTAEPRPDTPTLQVTCPSDEGDTQTAIAKKIDSEFKDKSEEEGISTPPSPGFSIQTERNRYWVRARPGTPRHARGQGVDRPDSPESRYSMISNLSALSGFVGAALGEDILGESLVGRLEKQATTEVEGEGSQGTPIASRRRSPELQSPETPGEDTLGTPKL